MRPIEIENLAIFRKFDQPGIFFPIMKKKIVEKSQNFIEIPFRNTQQRLLTPPGHRKRASRSWGKIEIFDFLALLGGVRPIFRSHLLTQEIHSRSMARLQWGRSRRPEGVRRSSYVFLISIFVGKHVGNSLRNAWGIRTFHIFLYICGGSLGTG